MKKRYIKKLDMELSPLGFGIMRLPMENKQFTGETYKMIERAMEAGINYYDTAYPYQMSRSEEFVRDTLVSKYPRDSFHIADKLPVWECKNRDDMERIFQTQLERLGVTYIDLYLLHALTKSRWTDVYDQGVLDFLEQKRKEGKIRKIGFSLHDDTETLAKIESAFEWDFIQLQINYYDWTAQRADKSYEFLAKKGIPCIVMEPVGGGRLSKLPENAEKLLKDVNPDASISSWAIRFSASLPNVVVTLSGMSNMEQLLDNITSFSPTVPLSDNERETLNDVVQIINSYNAIPCTSCKYCVGDCPKEIDIPHIFQSYNDSKLFANAASFEIGYFEYINEDKRGCACINCGKCIKACPQEIDVPKQLNHVHNVATNKFLKIDIEELKQNIKEEPNSILVCFGTGQRGKMTQSIMNQVGINIDYFCDNSEQLWDTKINNIPIISPMRLQDIANQKIYVLITCNAYNAIKTQIECLNKGNIIVLNKESY